MEFIPPPKGEDNVVLPKLKILKNFYLNPIAIGMRSSQHEQGIGLQAAQWETLTLQYLKLKGSSAPAPVFIWKYL